MSDWIRNMGEMSEPMTTSALIILAIGFIFVGIPILKKSFEVTKTVYGENEQGNTEKIQVKVISKTTYSPKYCLERINFVLFEKRNGERIELAIKDEEQYKTILEGDVGILTHIGKRYISFKR